MEFSKDEMYLMMLYSPGIKSGLVEAKGILEMQLETIAEKLTNEYWDEYGEQFFDSVENSFLEAYDRDNIEMAF